MLEEREERGRAGATQTATSLTCDKFILREQTSRESCVQGDSSSALLFKCCGRPLNPVESVCRNGYKVPPVPAALLASLRGDMGM